MAVGIMSHGYFVGCGVSVILVSWASDDMRIMMLVATK